MTLTTRPVWLLLLGIPLVVVWPAAGTVVLWGAVVALAVVADLVLAARPRDLALDRAPTEAIRWGESTTTTLRVEARGRRRWRGILRDAWQPTAGAGRDRHPLDLAPGAAATLGTELTPTRRGLLRTDRVTVRSRGPLGLAGWQASHEVPGEVHVLPAFPSRRHLPSRLARLRELDGRSAVQVRAPGTEFDSLREYVRGDDIRSLDWRATARRRSLVVRTWQPERDRRILVVLDTSRVSAGRVGDLPRLDAGMDAVLLLCALASRAGDQVAFLAGDLDLRARVAAVGRQDLLPTLNRVMMPLEPSLSEADWNRLAGAAAAEARHASLIVVVSPLEPQPVRETLLPVLGTLSARSQVVLASVADPTLAEVAADRSDPQRAHDAAAAERARLLREDAARAVEATGVAAIDAPAEDLAPKLADHYLMLKALGRL